MTAPINKGFQRKRESSNPKRIPPGQYETDVFPVLTAGPTQPVKTQDWLFMLDGLIEAPVSWNWDEFNALPKQSFKVDIHCVTKWSKLDTNWEGVGIDSLLERVVLKPAAEYVMAYSHGGYTTNIPLNQLKNGKAFIAINFDGKPLTAEHGGPARLVIPGLYFWKSAKWIKGLHFMATNEPGFWESNGYSLQADPWSEQRYRSDD